MSNGVGDSVPCPPGSMLVAAWHGDGTLQAGRRAETLLEACMHLGLCSSRNTHQQGSPNAGVNPIRARQQKGQCSGSPCGTIPRRFWSPKCTPISDFSRKLPSCLCRAHTVVVCSHTWHLNLDSDTRVCAGGGGHVRTRAD